jgi:predicted transcriptional regulator
MKKLFLKIKPSSVLMLLKDSQQQWYPSKLARASNSSYVHTVNLLIELRNKGVVSIEKKGRQNFYKLTEKGAHLAVSLDDFAKKCDAFEQEQKASSAKAEAEKQSAAPPAQHATQQAQKGEKAQDSEKK